jgi:hypothetical protein
MAFACVDESAFGPSPNMSEWDENSRWTLFTTYGWKMNYGDGFVVEMGD